MVGRSGLQTGYKKARCGTADHAGPAIDFTAHHGALTTVATPRGWRAWRYIGTSPRSMTR
jgi:hypothetical protein